MLVILNPKYQILIFTIIVFVSVPKIPLNILVLFLKSASTL